MDLRKHRFLIIIASLAIIAMSVLAVKFSGRQILVGEGNQSNVGQDKIENNVIESLAPQSLPRQVLLNVPFTPQAPFGNWDDVRQDNGCEEACLYMAMAWVNNKDISAQEALREILAMVDFQLKNYGHFHDTSAQDTLKLLKEFYQYEKAFVQYDIGARDIKNELARGNLVIVPINGKKVDNPFYTEPGPDQHKIMVKGYDDDSQEFITNDPGIGRGNGYRYKYDILEGALMDYESGFHEPIDKIRTAMIVVQK